MTRAQRDALAVLARSGGWCEGWKRASTDGPPPRVNMRAAGALSRMQPRLVDCRWPDRWVRGVSAFVHETRYRINEAGRAAAGG